MNATQIIAIIACATSVISLVYTMANNSSKKNSVDAAQFAELRATLANRADNAEVLRMSAKIDFMCQNIADMKLQFDKLQDSSRDVDKRLTIVEKWKEESDL